MTDDKGFSVERVRIRNQGSACTSAAALAALELLGVPQLPDLATMSLALGAPVPLAAPGLLDYITLPGRRSPLDLAIEAVASHRGRPVRSRTGLVAPWRALHARAGEVLIAHLAWGQERPGVLGTWGFRLRDRRTWSTGGHSVVVLEGGPGSWRVLDPNFEDPQTWSRPGWAVTATRVRPWPATAPG